jgi:hypothetical protein
VLGKSQFMILSIDHFEMLKKSNKWTPRIRGVRMTMKKLHKGVLSDDGIILYLLGAVTTRAYP